MPHQIYTCTISIQMKTLYKHINKNLKLPVKIIKNYLHQFCQTGYCHQILLYILGRKQIFIHTILNFILIYEIKMKWTKKNYFFYLLKQQAACPEEDENRKKKFFSYTCQQIFHSVIHQNCINIELFMVKSELELIVYLIYTCKTVKIITVIYKYNSQYYS